MKKYIPLILITLLLSLTSCSSDERADYMALIESTDFERQVEILPQLLESEKLHSLYPLDVYEQNEIDYAYDVILSKYVVALIETENYDILSNDIVDILNRFRRVNSAADALILIKIHYTESLQIIIPEIEQYYGAIEEYRLWYRYKWATLLWMAAVDYDDELTKRIDDELDRVLVEELIIAFDYERQIFEGEISIEDVPELYKYEVNRLIQGRQEDGPFDIDIWR